VRRAAIAKAVSACALLVGVGVGVASVGCTSASRAPRATLSVQGVNDAPEAAHAEPAPKSVDAVAADGRSRAPAPEGREDRLIARTLKKVSDARGLAATRGVPGVTLSREALIARVKAHVAREIPPVAIRQEGLVLQLLGFVPLDFDYEAETFKLLEAQLAGFYEPSDGTMYMAADLDDDNADATLAHELVHALQDQHYDLKPHSKYTPGQSDKALIVEESGRMIGFLLGFIAHEPVRTGYVHLVGIHPDFRRRGVGRLLYETFTDTCRAAECGRMKAITTLGNEGSQSFHLALGWDAQDIEDYAGPSRKRIVFTKDLGLPTPALLS
jgi:GNAT superfamily N-acetyltransferase